MSHRHPFPAASASNQNHGEPRQGRRAGDWLATCRALASGGDPVARLRARGAEHGAGDLASAIARLLPEIEIREETLRGPHQGRITFFIAGPIISLAPGLEAHQRERVLARALRHIARAAAVELAGIDTGETTVCLWPERGQRFLDDALPAGKSPNARLAQSLWRRVVLDFDEPSLGSEITMSLDDLTDNEATWAGHAALRDATTVEAVCAEALERVVWCKWLRWKEHRTELFARLEGMTLLSWSELPAHLQRWLEVGAEFRGVATEELFAAFAAASCEAAPRPFNQ